MPEGDTIYRAATQLRRWLEGREITNASAQRSPRAPVERLVGTTLEGVESRGKHLLMRFSSGHVLHTHMRMSGSWHVYVSGERWQKPDWQARVVLEAGERQAVCFNAPVVELLRDRGDEAHPAMSRLGPDILDDDFDLSAALARAAQLPADVHVGELLLDQRVSAGIGNIYRCESLFLERVDPWARRAEVGEGTIEALLATARKLMRANVGNRHDGDRGFGLAPGENWVYGRSGRPCRRCGALIKTARLGRQARLVYWCVQC
ncbi:MAG: Fpg/Nei family DNA glycosylase, partial [Acidimicrobiia bacterium]